MNAFANSWLSVLLGWVKGIAKAVFDFFSAERSGTFLEWLGDHWLFAAVVLCLFGVAADVLVWLIRYKPYARVKHPKKPRKRELLDPDAFMNGYNDGMDLGPEPARPAPVAGYAEEYRRTETPLPEAPAPGGFAPSEEPVRRRRADRYVSERSEGPRVLERLRRILPEGGDTREEQPGGPDRHYYDPVYPQGDASEWEKWNSEQK